MTNDQQIARLPELLESRASLTTGPENRRARELMKLAARRIRELESFVAESDLGDTQKKEEPVPNPFIQPPPPKNPGYTVRRITFK